MASDAQIKAVLEESLPSTIIKALTMSSTAMAHTTTLSTTKLFNVSSKLSKAGVPLRSLPHCIVHAESLQPPVSAARLCPPGKHFISDNPLQLCSAIPSGKTGSPLLYHQGKLALLTPLVPTSYLRQRQLLNRMPRILRQRSQCTIPRLQFYSPLLISLLLLLKTYRIF